MDFEAALRSNAILAQGLSGLAVDPAPRIPVLSAKVKLLWDCNLSCSYCPDRPYLPPLKRTSVSKALKALVTFGLKKVHFSGGEVFLHPEITGIMSDAVKMNLQVNLTTNATMLDRALIKELGATGVHSLSVSIDSARAAEHDQIRGQKGAFKATLKAMKIIASNPKKFPKLRVNTVVTAQNSIGEKLDELHELVSSLGECVRWKLIPVDSDDKHVRPARQTLSALREKARRWSILEDIEPFGADITDDASFTAGKYGHRRSICYVPWLHLFIDPTGYCYPCCMSARKMSALGHIDHDRMEEILYGKKSTEFKMNMASGHLARFCKRCDDFKDEGRTVLKVLDDLKPAAANR